MGPFARVLAAALVLSTGACSADAFTATPNDAAVADDAAVDAGANADVTPVGQDGCAKGCDAPVVPIANVAWAHGLELDGAYVYYTTSDFAPNAINVVARVPKSGGNSQPLASPEAAPQNLVVRSGSVYWTNWNTATVRAVDPTNPTATRRTVADLTGIASGLFGITATSSELYVGSNPDRYVYRLPLVGNVADAGALQATKLGNPSSGPPNGQIFQVTSQGNSLFWAALGPDGIQSIDLAAPTIVKHWTKDAITPWGIAVSPDAIVYTDRDARRVVRVRRSDGDVLVLASQNLAEPRGVTIDGPDVYFCDFGAGVVYRVPLDGSAPPKVFADNQSGALLVRTDAQSVYWTRYHPAAGGVYARAK
jgi:hypothetical protein